MKKELKLSEKEMICCENMNGMPVYPSVHIKEFIKEMDNWAEKIGRRTLVTAETFIEILKNRAGDLK